MTEENALQYGYENGSGISIVYDPSDDTIDISGWYDGFMNIKGGSMPFTEFAARLGVNIHRDKVLDDAPDTLRPPD